VWQGKRLFRAAGAAVLFIVAPKVAVRNQKRLTMEQEAAELAVALPLYFEQCKAWVGKVTKPTVTSILQVRRRRRSGYHQQQLPRHHRHPHHHQAVGLRLVRETGISVGLTGHHVTHRTSGSSWI
jgi:hypothetical protein